MKKLIINADDFGYRKEINRGVVYAHQNGLVTSASLFVEKDGTQEAVAQAKANPSLGLGIHLDMDKFFEVDHHLGTIAGMLPDAPSQDTIRDEARRQLDKYYSFGFSADHLDSHHHAHLHPYIFSIMCQLAKEYKIPVVRIFSKHFAEQLDFDKAKKILSDNGIKSVDHFIEGWYWGNVDEPYEAAELMTHPGYGEIWREAELAHCCQPQLRQYFVDQNIELLRFSDVFPQ